MPQTTTPAAAKKPALPPMPEFHRNTDRIYVFKALNADAAHAHLDSIHAAALKRSKWRSTNATRAIWAAICGLLEQQANALDKVRERGELLFCWHGTKSTEVAA